MLEVVCALIEDAQGRLLLAKRPAGKHLAGFWEFPGGKREAGESSEEALHREISEELGCTLIVDDALRVVTHAYPQVTVRLAPFLARLHPDSAEPTAREHDALRWVTASEFADLELPDADRPILAEWLARRRAPGIAGSARFGGKMARV